MALYKNVAGKSNSGTVLFQEGINNIAQLSVSNAGHYKITFGGTSSSGQSMLIVIADDPNFENQLDYVNSTILHNQRTLIETYDAYLASNTTIYCRIYSSGSTWTKVFLEIIPVE